jgi:SAM-dependent methyltransferase
MLANARSALGRALRSIRGAGADATALHLGHHSALLNHHSLQLDHLIKMVDELQRENRLLLGRMSLPPQSSWKGKPGLKPGGPAESAFPTSTICRQKDFEEPYFSYWSERIGHTPVYTRKLWEFVYICQALFERGLLQHGARGLGFGVGEEPLAALFASQGCTITATDLALEGAVASGWSDSQQHAQTVEALRVPWLCPNDVFDRNVSFRPVDMNAIPDDLRGFDFCWSSCAFEHLGSIEKGLQFVENSVDTLRPGGFAVHTTEFNLFSDHGTVDNTATVLFRRRDFLELAQRLQAKGHIVAPFDLEPGEGEIDRYIDVPPYLPEPHLTLELAGYATTSIGVIVQRAPA